MVSYFSRGIGHAKLSPSVISAVPGRRTLINGFSAFGMLTREVKYINPTRSKGWREKHKGVAPLRRSWPQEILALTSVVEHKGHGWDAISMVRRLQNFPYLERNMANPRAQIHFWPTLEGSFLVVDAQAIKVSDYHYNFSGPIETD